MPLPPHAPPAPVLVADIGGTNTRLALADGPVLRQGSIRRVLNAGQPSLAPILARYLAETGGESVAGLCLAVAGPVRDGVAQMTNLDWTISAAALAADLGIPRVLLLNDLQAQGHALAGLSARALRPILHGQPAPAEAARLVVGAGTGFNAAPVHYAHGRTVVPPSECGHIHLPRHGQTEEALARHLAQTHGIATVEEALCGRGLVTLHSWLNGTALAGDAILAALAAGDAAALRTGQLYARLMGRTLATLALTHLPWGGIYLIGGVARAFAPHLAGLGLGQAYAEMGRFSDLVRSIPVWSVEDDYAALAGCAAALAEAGAADPTVA
jgi:glucokinase